MRVSFACHYYRFELELRAYFVTVVCMLAASPDFALNNQWLFAVGPTMRHMRLLKALNYEVGVESVF